LWYWSADLHGSAYGPNCLLLPVWTARRLSASRWPTYGRAFHVQRAIRGCRRRGSVRGYGCVLSQLERRASTLLHAHGESTLLSIMHDKIKKGRDESSMKSKFDGFMLALFLSSTVSGRFFFSFCKLRVLSSLKYMTYNHSHSSTAISSTPTFVCVNRL